MKWVEKIWRFGILVRKETEKVTWKGDDSITVSKAQMKATREWERKNYDIVSLRLPKGTKDRIRNLDETVNGFIVSATLEKLEKEESREK